MRDMTKRIDKMLHRKCNQSPSWLVKRYIESSRLLRALIDINEKARQDKWRKFYETEYECY